MMQHVHPTLIQATRTVSEISGNEVLITVSVILANCIHSSHGLNHKVNRYNLLFAYMIINLDEPERSIVPRVTP